MSHRPLAARHTSASRRSFLAGAAAFSLLAACGDDDAPSPGPEQGAGPTGDGDGQLSVVRFYGPFFVAGAANRVPFGLADEGGLLPAGDSPQELAVTVADPDGNVVADAVPAVLRGEGLPRGYYSFEFTPETAGFYDFSTETDSGEVLSQLQVVEPDDPTVADLIGPGDPMPALETPTVDDPRGVTPICTKEPACDLHGVTVARALEEGGPVVLLVATPAFCQTAVCGPVLDVMIDQMGGYPDVRFVHAEVFADPENNSTPIAAEDYAPVIGELGLPFEPVLYTIGADGAVRERLDYIFDGTEIDGALARLVG
jgi:hypothetical protein